MCQIFSDEPYNRGTAQTRLHQFDRAIADDDSAGERAGAAYLFDGSTGQLLRTFLNPSPATHVGFGSSVTALGESVLIGSGVRSGEVAHGKAFLFDPASGDLLQTFLSPKLSPTPEPFSEGYDSFGWDLIAVGDNVLIGAAGDDTIAHNGGTAYLFDGSTGELLQQFQTPMPRESGFFGRSVAATGGNVLIGADFSQHFTRSHPGGAAYLFEASTGKLLQTFENPTPANGDVFGRSLAAVGDAVLIGAWLDDTSAEKAGIAYLFDTETGDLLHTFLNPSLAEDDRYFGNRVATVGNNLLISAVGHNSLVSNTGVVYLFQGPGIASDLTRNGFVDFEDLTLLLANWNQEVGSALGNLVDPANTPVNFEDLTVLLADWTGPAPGAALDNEAVPEPSTLALALVAALALVLRLRRPPACRGACR